jgi:hypothetical protein
LFFDITEIKKRADELEEWINQNGKGCKKIQRHLDKNTPEKIYWHYGYLVALRDVIRLSEKGSYSN